MCSLPQASGNDLCFMLIVRNSTVLLEQLDDSSTMDCEQQGSTLTYQANRLFRFNNSDGYFYSEEQPTSGTWFSGQPFNMEVDFLPPDFSQVPNTTMFHRVQIHETYLYLSKSVGGYVNNYEIEHKRNDQFAFQN